MTKKLILLRHAKSDWEAPYKGDFDRPLNERGRKAALKMGAYAREQGLMADLILCSSALRTRQTCGLFMEGAGMSEHHISLAYEDLIYGADMPDIISLIQKYGADHTTVMIIGHNPTVGALTYTLSPSHSHDYGKFPTASFASFTFEGTSWAEFGTTDCTFFGFVKPSDLT